MALDDITLREFKMTKLELIERLKDVADNAIIQVTVIDDNGDFIDVPVTNIYQSLDVETGIVHITLDGDINENYYDLD